MNILTYILVPFFVPKQRAEIKPTYSKAVLYGLQFKGTFGSPSPSQNVEPRCPASLNFNLTTFLIASSYSWAGFMSRSAA
jgi:hypothetical protein